MIRVFLVEDEPPAMRKLKRMVAEQPDLDVCGYASTVSEAIAGITATHPNLVVLDIRLPDGTGFEILQALDEVPELRSLQAAEFVPGGYHRVDATQAPVIFLLGITAATIGGAICRP